MVETYALAERYSFTSKGKGGQLTAVAGTLSLPAPKSLVCALWTVFEHAQKLFVHVQLQAHYVCATPILYSLYFEDSNISKVAYSNS